MPRTYSELYISVRNTLRSAGVEAANVEARLIAATASGKTTAQLLRDMALYDTDEVEKKVGDMLRRRLAGEPVAYITRRVGVPWTAYGSLARCAHTACRHRGAGRGSRQLAD